MVDTIKRLGNVSEDTIKRLGAVSEDGEELRRHIFSTYRWMRIGMLLIALAFPPLLIIGGFLHSVPFQGSMSAYYWAPPTPEGGDPPMRVWFVGILFALGSCLFLYKGYTRLEDWVLNVAAVCAICVALFPMCWDRWSECPSFSWHGFFAICFFVLLALVAVLHWLYTSGRLRGRAHRRSAIYSKWYVGTSLGMVVFPLVTWILFETNGAQIFLVEFAGIVAFCLFWGVQSRQIRKSRFDQELAQSDLRVVAASLERSLGLDPDLFDPLGEALRSGDSARVDEATLAYIRAACDSYHQGHGEHH